MATFNGGRMVALFLSVVFALNASFAQQPKPETYILYMEDPVNEITTQAVNQWRLDWLNPLTWMTKADFDRARDSQRQQVEMENNLREARAYALLNAPENRLRGEGITSWVPSWIPLARAKPSNPNVPDSLFLNILNLRGVKGQTLEQFMNQDGKEPLPTGTGERDCIVGERCAQGKNLLFAFFQTLINAEKQGTRVISVRFKATRVTTTVTPPTSSTESFVEELEIGNTTIPGPNQPPHTSEAITLEQGSVELLEGAWYDDRDWVIDVPPYGDPGDGPTSRRAAKPVSSTETSSWGRIKATFADD